MNFKEKKCKTCGKDNGTFYIENKEFYCEEHCEYLNKEDE